MALSDFVQSVSPETKADTVKAVIGTGVGSGGFAFTLDMFVGLLTAIYLLGCIGLLVPKYIREYRAWQDKRAKE